MDNNRTHSGGLYCSEGSTHVSRPSIKVKQTPGGNSSWNFLSMNQVDDSKPAKPHFAHHVIKSPPKTHQKHAQSKTVQQEAKENVAQQQQQQQPQQQQQTNSNNNANWNNALFCNEGSQVRGRPSVRVRQPCGGNTSWNFLSSN